jgi:hypothetical protein
MAVWHRLFVTAICIGAATSAHASTYDAVKNFSTTTNTAKSRWSYAYNATGTRDGNYTLIPSTVLDNTQWHKGKVLQKVEVWASPAGPSFADYVAVNKTASAWTTDFCCGTVTWPAHSIYLNPAYNGVSDTVVSFLAPKSGTASITYSFTHIDPHGGTGISWFVDLNSGLSGDLASGTLSSAVSTTGTLTLSVAVKKGDRVNFIASPNANNPTFESSVMTATITY